MLAVLALTAQAQQPLDAFVRAGDEAALDGRIAAEDLREAQALRIGAFGALLPRLSATGGYTRNQQAIEATFPDGSGGFDTAVISAKDQLDASFRAELVVVDVGAWSRYLSSGANVAAADARLTAARAQVAEAVVASWHRLVAARDVEAAAILARDTADETLSVVEARKAAGLASDLDVERSRADRARAEQQRAEATLEVALASRQLFVLTGIEASEEAVELEDARAEEPPLDDWIRRLDQVPSVAAARAAVRASAGERAGAVGAMVPSLSAFATERWTNAAGFGPDWLWSAGLQARWSLDVTRAADLEARAAANSRARLQADRAVRDAESAIHDGWHRVASLGARVDASRAFEEAAVRAASVARTRFEAGTASALEVSVAERDRFDAEVARIRADSDLHVARRQLRLAAGLPPTLESGP